MEERKRRMVIKRVHLERKNSLLIIQKMRMLMKQKWGKRKKRKDEVEATREETEVVRSQ